MADFGEESIQTSELPLQNGSVLDEELVLEDLDDIEYHNPPVDNLPTLESIVNEDEHYASEDEMFPPTHHQNFLPDPYETVSVASRESSDTRSLCSSGKRRKELNEEWQKKQSTIVRHMILKGLSSQVQSANERVNTGDPTAIAVTYFIAIGTSHGIVLVFYPSQALKWCLGETGIGEQYGAVSSMAFNIENTRLLVGYGKGPILMYDITNGKLLRTITDAHPPATAVLQLKFTDQPTLALCSDSGGSVFELNFKRTIGVRGCDSRCLFSGSRGEVCAISPLLLYRYPTHPLHDVVMVALATLSKVIVVTIRPRMKVLFTHALRCDPSTLPLITWQFVIIQVASTSRVVDPVLAFARESSVYFYQVTVGSKDKVHFVPLQRLKTTYNILNLHWFNTLTLAIFDTSECLHLVDVRTQEELEVAELGEVRLVYGSAHFKGLATGGNVSKAMALAGERATYDSIANFSGQLFLLGAKSIHVLMLRTWSERIDHLTKQNYHLGALSLGLSFYEDRGKAVIGLKGLKETKKQIIKEKLCDVLSSYITDTVMSNCPTITNGGLAAQQEYFVEVVPACVEYCVAFEWLDILFETAYDTFCNHEISHAIYLESLEPYILNDQVKDVPLVIAKEFVSHYEEKQYFKALEACIVHLNITSVDIHQVMKLSLAQGLYDTIICIYNRGMMDYTTPIKDLITIVQQALDTGKQLSEFEISLGNKLLVYISCCLAGRAYPIGETPLEDIPKMKHEVFSCITSLHTADPSDTEQAYPYLRTLLHFDTREFLNVLALAFEEEEFTTELGLRQRQRIVDILLQVMVHGEGFSIPTGPQLLFQPTQVGALFTFLARQMARHEHTIYVDRQLFEQVVEYLTSPGDGSRHEERQQALLELLEAGDLQHYKEDKLLQHAEGAKFYRVCELLYEKREEYDKIMLCYLRDPTRKLQVFSYLRNLFVPPSDKISSSALEKQIIEDIQELVNIDKKKIAEITYTYIPHAIPEIITKLQSNEPLLYTFLQGLFEYYLQQMQTNNNNNNIQSKEYYVLDPAIQERYIELMCHYHPAQVYTYIKSTDDYRLEEVLEMCKEHKLTDAVAYLLEKAGDVHGAFNLMLNKLEDKIENVLKLFSTQSVGSSEESLVWSQLNGLVLVLVQICQRNAAHLDEKAREQLCFPLLERVLALQHSLKPMMTKQHQEACQEMMRHILNSMLSYVSLPAILQTILQDPTYSQGKFGEIKQLLLGMLETYNYEDTLLTTTQRLLHADLHCQLNQLYRTSHKGFVSHSIYCTICKKPLQRLTENDQVVFFKCGHCFHGACLDPVTNSQPHCYKCVQSSASSIKTSDSPKKATAHKSSFLRSPSGSRNVLDAEQMDALSQLRSHHRYSVSHADGSTSFQESVELHLDAPRNIDIGEEF